MIYFIQAHDGGPIKIGWAKNIDKRIAEIQRMSPSQLRVLNTFDSSEEDERILHKYFKRIRLYGEWFEPTDELLAFVQNPHKVELPPKPKPEFVKQVLDGELESVPYYPDKTTVASTAAYLKTSPFTVLRLIKRHSIQAKKFCGIWLVDKRSVDDYIERNKDKEKNDPHPRLAHAPAVRG